MLTVASGFLKDLKSLQNRGLLQEAERSIKNIYYILQKELRVYFNSPVAYIVIIAFLLISGWLFSSQIFLNKQATLEYFLSDIPLLLVFIVPAVSMRLFAEEQKVGTIKILATLPLRDFEIIMGKYLAAFALMATAVLSMLIHPVTLSFLGNIDWGRVAGSYLGLMLLIASFMAIGLFASSITKNQIVAFIIGFVICFAFFIIGKVLDLVPSFMVNFVEYFGIDSHFENISKGLIDSRDLIYYASVIIFFLYAAYLTMRSRKESRKFNVGIFSSSTMVLMLCALIFANYISFSCSQGPT